MRTSISVFAIVLTVVSAVPRVHAQTAHAVTPSALDAAIQQHVADTAETRAAVLRVLNRPEVKAQADRFGVDLRSAASAVATLEGEQLTALSAQAAQVDQALAGGQSRVVISTTMIIVALLVLILLIVAID